MSGLGIPTRFEELCLPSSSLGSRFSRVAIQPIPRFGFIVSQCVTRERQPREDVPDVPSNWSRPGVEILAAVPGVSTQTARALLARFGSVGGLLAAGPDRWAEVQGVGAVRAHALAAALLNGAERPADTRASERLSSR